MKNKIKELLPYILGFLIVSSITFYPELGGKKLAANDSVSASAAVKEWKDYEEKGENIYWSNRIFSGMPIYILTSKFPGNYLVHCVYLVLNWSSYNIFGLFLCMTVTFLSLKILNIESKVSFILGLAFGLNTWIVSSLWAGHITKILSLAFLFPVICGVISYIQLNKKIGLIFTLIGLSMAIGFNHVQIVYYGAIMVFVIAIYFAIEYYKNSKLNSLLRKFSVLIIVATIAVLSNFYHIFTTYEYSKNTMRGGKTEITSSQSKSTSKDGGLDINYAFSWSYRVSELFNFIVPDAMGGTSSYKVKTSKSKLAQAINPNEKTMVLPLYWGIQPFTNSPNYLGVAIIVFFIFSLFYSKKSSKYAFLTIFILSMMMGLGRSFLGFNEFLFNHLPLYKNFRTPTMSYSMLNLIAIVAISAPLQSIIRKDFEVSHLQKSLKYTGFSIIALFILGFLAVSSDGYTSPNDLRSFGNNKEGLQLMVEDRESFFKADVWRSLLLVATVLFVIFFYVKDKIKKNVFIIILGLLILFDLSSVHRRYLDYSEFIETEDIESLIPNESYNQFLEQDKSHFRIFNTTNQNIFNDNTDGYRFSNIGGYSPAKLYRYQDLIDRHLSKGSMPVLNMLNTKYFIVDNQGQKVPQQNPDACGNAWFINEVKFAENADVEIDSLSSFDPKNTVWIDQRYQSDVKFSVNTDPNASIQLTKYHPDNMEYKSASKTGGFVVFSEIWYRGNEDWKLYINGEEGKLIRVNYALRGAYIPAGENEILMKFKPMFIKRAEIITIVFTLVLLAVVLMVIYSLKEKKENA